MTKAEYAKFQTLITQANELLDGPPKENNQITNMDVLEAVLGDIRNVMNGWKPFELTKLIELDAELAGQ